MKKESSRFIGKVLFLNNYGTEIKIEHCFDVSDEIFPISERRKSLWLGLTRCGTDDLGVQLICSESHLGAFRTLRELRTGETSSIYGSPVFDEAFVHQLKMYGLTPESFKALVERAVQLQHLIELFADKRVRITHANNCLQDIEGVCKTVHTIPGSAGHFDLEMVDGGRVGFTAEVITSNSVDGELKAFAGGRRKIELI